MSTATADAVEATPEQMQPQAWGDPTGKGIIAGMDEFFDKLDNPSAASAPAAEPKAAEPAAKAPEPPAKAAEAPTPSAVKETAPKPVEPIVEAIEENFFKSKPAEEPAKDPAAFDEAAFDKETEEQIKGMDAKAGEKFKALKAELKAAKQAASPALLKELEEAKVKAQEVEGLRERMKELSSQSAKLTVETSDEYINEVKKPLIDVFSTLDKLSGVYEMDPAILRALVREDDRKVQAEMIKTHLSAFDPLSRDEVFSSVRKFNELLDKRDAMMENAEKDLGARQAKMAQENQRLLDEQRKAVQTLQLEKWSRWEKAIPGLLDADGKPTAEYTRMKNESLSLDFGQAQANDMAFAALSGVLLPFAQKQIIALQTELREYRKADGKALEGAPNTGSSIAPTPPAEGKPKGFLEGFINADFA